MPAKKKINTKLTGSFRMEKEVKIGIEKLAKQENRTFNNMLEMICRRAIENNK